MTPLKIGSAAEFQAVREFLASAGFREGPLVELAGLKRLAEVLDGKGRISSGNSKTPLGVLARLLVLGEYVSSADLEAALSPPVLAAMRTLGLAVSDEAPEGQWFSPVMLAPVVDLYIVSDRVSRPDKAPHVAPGDVVFPAITTETGRFLRLIPGTPCRSLLDIGAGSGAGALVASRTVAEEAVSLDITARATHFAEFNARLNGIANVTAVEGDLYAPVKGRTFHRIIAHPPYVPALKTEWVFRDAGDTGEAITRGVIGGLPEFLEPGGRLYCLTTALDLKERKLELRVQDWLGDHAAEFDVVLIEYDEFTLKGVAADLVLRGQRPANEGRQLLSGFEKLDAERFVHALIVVQRHAGGRAPFVVRKSGGSRTASPEIEWFLDWRTRSSEPGFEPHLLNAPYEATGNVRVKVSQVFDEGDLVVEGIGLKTDYPFDSECDIQPWTARFLAECGRPKTGIQIYEFCRAEGLVRGDVSASDFTQLLRMLVDDGYLEIGTFKLPAAAE